MSTRGELYDHIYGAFDALDDPSEKRDTPSIITEVLLAAGYSKPRTITTAEELDALPDGSAVLDDDGDASTKHNGMWHGYEMSPLASRWLATCGPFTVLYETKSA
jgi:hypothetical protein